MDRETLEQNPLNKDGSYVKLRNVIESISDLDLIDSCREMLSNLSEIARLKEQINNIESELYGNKKIALYLFLIGDVDEFDPVLLSSLADKCMTKALLMHKN